jgi:hypothetical protein
LEILFRCWSGKSIDNVSYPVRVEETFHIFPKNGIWIDFVTIWKRVELKETDIVLSDNVRNSYGPLRNILKEYDIRTQSKIYIE